MAPGVMVDYGEPGDVVGIEVLRVARRGLKAQAEAAG
jgi:uncharacterized protein YuzE